MFLWQLEAHSQETANCHVRKRHFFYDNLFSSSEREPHSSQIPETDAVDEWEALPTTQWSQTVRISVILIGYGHVMEEKKLPFNSK